MQRKLSIKLPFLHRKRIRNTGKTVYCKYTDDDCKISSADATALFDGKAESDSELHARNKALGNVTITCTATFNDGTQKSVNIKVKHQKLTGAQVQNSKFNKDKKYIFVTFEVDA